MSDFVTLKHINKNYGDYQASVDINFNIQKGQLVALLGPSGSGKTTILRMIAGLETPDLGEILIDGKVVNDLPGSKRGIGFVFQNYALFRYMTVFENIASGLQVLHLPKAQIKERVNELIRLVGLEGLGKRYPSELSGGQRQRVAIARALATKAPVILADEPTANLDSKNGDQILELMKTLNKELETTFIFSTHDAKIVNMADHVIKISDGKIISA